METYSSHSIEPITHPTLHSEDPQTATSRKIFYISGTIFAVCIVGCIFAGIWNTKAYHHCHVVPNKDASFGSFVKYTWSSHRWKSIATLSAFGIAGACIGMLISGGFAIVHLDAAFPDTPTKTVRNKQLQSQTPPLHQELLRDRPSINSDYVATTCAHP